MANRIVRVTLEWDARKGPRHPHVERVMQEQIRQQGTNYALNAKDNFQFERKIFGWRERRCVLDLRLKR